MLFGLAPTSTRSSHLHHRHGQSGSPDLLWLLLSSFLLYKPHPTKSCDWHSRPSSGGCHHTGWMNPTKNWLQLCLRSLVPSFLLPHQGLRLPRSFLLTSSLCRESGGTSILIDYSPLPLLLGRSTWSFPSSPRTILTLRRAGWRCSAFELSILSAVEVAIFTASVFCRDNVFL